jgi:energy-converting hydrogenase Eha subunit A
MFWSALVISVIVTAVCMLGTTNRVRGAILAFALSVMVATVLLMLSGHWVFSSLSYYVTVIGAAFLATIVGLLIAAAARRAAS